MAKYKPFREWTDFLRKFQALLCGKFLFPDGRLCGGMDFAADWAHNLHIIKLLNSMRLSQTIFVFSYAKVTDCRMRPRGHADVKSLFGFGEGAISL